MRSMFFERLQKRFEDIVTQCWSGFFLPAAWRFIAHKVILWAAISSPLFIAEAYGLITATSAVPKFLSDFLSSATNLGWVLGVPIISSIIVGGLFCLIGANELKRVAIDDARRAPGTVAAIWFFLGVFFASLASPEGIAAGNYTNCDVHFYRTPPLCSLGIDRGRI